MPTKRTPIHRAGRIVITPAVIEAFERLRDADNDEAATRAHSDLVEALDPLWRPWRWPAVAPPDQPCPYWRGTGGAEWWPQAQQLWIELDKAARAAEPKRKRRRP